MMFVLFMACGTEFVAPPAPPPDLVVEAPVAPLLPPPPPPKNWPDPPYNIVIITADTLRGDVLPMNGNDELYTPHLQRLADQGVNFTRAYTPITTTLPAHASLLSSLYPSDHRAYSNVSAISSRIQTLPEELRLHGYRTAAHINMPWLNPEVSNVPQGIQDIRRGDRVRKADKTIPWVLDYVEGRKDKEDPFFLWIHFVDNHTPYHAPAAYDSLYFEGEKGSPGQTSMEEIWDLFPGDHRRSEYFLSWVDGVESADYITGTYKGSLTWLDQHIGLLMNALEESDQWDNTLFVFTADHGESLGEHDLWFVHGGLYETTTHIPLILRVPGGPEGVSIDRLVSLVDVAPTVLAQNGFDIPQAMRGQDLLDPELPTSGGAALLEHTGRQLEGVVTERYKLIVHLKDTRIYAGYPMNKGAVELYDLQEDPGELRNIAEQNPGRVAQLQGMIPALKQGNLEEYEALSGEINEEISEQLQALGYFE